MHSFLRVWTIPLLMFFVGIGGLLSALLGDGWWDVASWVAMAAPLALIIYFTAVVHDSRRRQTAP